MLQSLKSIFAPIINKYNHTPPPAKSDKKRGWKQKGHWRKINGKHVWCGGKTD